MQKGSTSHQHDDKRFRQALLPYQARSATRYHVTITNTGDAPLIISEMQPSCGCIILDKSSHIIIPEDGIRQFKATYNSIKNVGEVVHRIRIFGNMLPDGRAELKFDVNVVPDADYTRDYEELYQEFNTKNGIVREMVDGKESELGYYVGEP